MYIIETVNYLPFSIQIKNKIDANFHKLVVTYIINMQTVNQRLA